MQNITLPKKFDPYIINSSSELKSSLDQIFQNVISNDEMSLSEHYGFQILGDKKHVVTHPDLPNYVVKGPRHDHAKHLCAHDSHIYRVRRATRLQSVIKRHGFSEIIIPKKMLYHHKGHWFVVAEKLNLDIHAKLHKSYDRAQETHFKQLTAKQVRELSVLCFEGNLEDVNETNIQFTSEGKIALVDTEPVSRALKKTFKQWLRLPYIKASFEFTNAMCNSERIYLVCSADDALKEVRNVQSQMFWRHLAEIIVKISLPLILIVGLDFIHAPTAISLIAETATVINFTVGLIIMMRSIWVYHWIRSTMGHFQILMA